MNNDLFKANVYILFTKVNSGLNTNALKFLLPFWILPIVLVNMRVILAAIVFYLITLFYHPPKIRNKEKLILMGLGALLIYGYLFFICLGVSKTTPISSSIFMSLQPVWVFLIGVFLFKDKISWKKVLGIAVGLTGALICILTQQSKDVANDSLIGDIYCLIGSLIYAFYMIAEKKMIQRGITTLNLLKYTFLGAGITGLIVSLFINIDAKIFHTSELTPWLLFAFILIFPTIINYLLTPIGLKFLKTTVVAIYGYVSLIVVAIVSYIVGQDHFSWAMLLSIVLICSSVYLVEEVAEDKK